jgi:hypothetical protein
MNGVVPELAKSDGGGRRTARTVAEDRRGPNQRRLLRFEDFRHNQTGESRGIGLDLRGMLAQHEEWAGRGVVVVLEEVVDEVWGKGNQIDEEEPRRQCADGSLLP